jgi:hypothetical protein
VRGIRGGSHPGYDRLVFDLNTTKVPLVFVAYRQTTATIVVGFSGQNVPAVVGGPHARPRKDHFFRYGCNATHNAAQLVLQAQTRGPRAEHLDLSKWVRIWHRVAISCSKIAVSGQKTFTGQHILPEDCDHPQGTALKQATWSTTSCGVSEKQPARERSLLN